MLGDILKNKQKSAPVLMTLYDKKVFTSLEWEFCTDHYIQ